MQTGLIIAALRRHRLATLLITMEIALACAVLCNAFFMLVEKGQALKMNSGVAESSLGVVQLSGFDAERASDLNARVTDALRAIPGVTSVGIISAVPFGEPGVRAGVNTDEANREFGGVLDFYLADAAAIKALEPTVLAGRLPDANEYAPVDQYVPANPPILVTRQLAERYWPGETAVGKNLWSMGSRFTVIGVVEHLVVSQPGGGEALGNDWSVLMPARPGPQLAGRYLVRASPKDLPRVFGTLQQAIAAVAPDVVFDQMASRTLPELRADYFQSARLMMALLTGVIFALLGATALGIVGLASYWVEQRRKQIGIRRALGATRTDILRYFQLENFLIVSLGIGIGLLLAYGLNLGLMRFYELPRLPLIYLPVSAALLWLLGQGAVLAPALKASAIPPMQAIRSI